MKSFSHVKDSNSGTRSRCLDLLILWPSSLPKSKFATFLLSKLRNFLWFSPLRGLKLPLQNFTARYLNHTFTFSLAFSFSLKKKKKKKPKQRCLICWNKFPVTFVFFLFTIYLSKAHKKYSSNRAQVSYSWVLRAKIPKIKKTEWTPYLLLWQDGSLSRNQKYLVKVIWQRLVQELKFDWLHLHH